MSVTDAEVRVVEDGEEGKAPGVKSKMLWSAGCAVKEKLKTI